MRVTTKGQVTIPRHIRAYLGIAPHTDVDFSIHEGRVVLTRCEKSPDASQRKFTSLRGILSGKLTTDEWMEATRSD